jgi:hypothetical protein
LCRPNGGPPERGFDRVVPGEEGSDRDGRDLMRRTLTLGIVSLALLAGACDGIDSAAGRGADQHADHAGHDHHGGSLRH